MFTVAPLVSLIVLKWYLIISMIKKDKYLNEKKK